MKKIFCIILLLFMCLLTLAACNNDNTADDIDNSQYNQNINNSSDIDKLVDENEQEEQMPNQDLIIIWSDVNDAEIIDISWNGDNSTTIDDIYGIIEEDIEQVYYASNQFWRESYFLFERQEQNTWLIHNLSRLELLEKAENYDKNTAKIYLTYVIQLKNAAPIILYFYDDVVDFGQGYYFYADTEKSAIPEKISTISISLPEFYTSIDYVDTDDINILRSLLNPFVSVDVHESSLYDTSELMSIFIYDEWIDYISLYIKEENGTYYLLKHFFASFIYMGEISSENYNSLIIACKGQLGTHKCFYVTSGDTTIYPLGYFVNALSFDEQTGQGVAVDGIPVDAQLNNIDSDKLESIYYAPNFIIWVKDENAILNIFLAETYTNITYKDIEELPAGNYRIECRLTTRGEYVEKADDYNSSTSVYWFNLIKP